MIGCFRYLNAYPYRRLLDWGGVPYRVFTDPKELAHAWVRREVEGALLPMRYARHTPWMLSWGIGSAGPVQSVLLLGEYPPEAWEAIVADAASTSSVALVQWLMKKGYLRPLPILERAWHGRVGRLFIGDGALRWRGFYPYSVDLGALVQERVGRPFVYAVWCIRGALRRDLRRLFLRPWDLIGWAEEAAWLYGLPATQVYAYWQGIQYRLSQQAVPFWRQRLPSLS
jgi:predicted solute-binding protein